MPDHAAGDTEDGVVDTIIISETETTVIASTEPELEVVVLDGTDQEVVFVGEVGLPGADGAPGTDAHFTQDFTGSSTVTVTHNLGKLPAVTVIDSAGDEVKGDVDHQGINQLVISFSAPFSGKVICN